MLVEPDLLDGLRRARDRIDREYASPLGLDELAGYGSLGTFSRRFSALVGESPSAYQARWSDGPPRIPACWIFMHGLSDRRNDG